MRHHRLLGPVPDQLRVVIEIKGPWNKDVITGMRRQLASRYLPEVESANGIYVVGWYPLELWSDKLRKWTGRSDYRRGRAKKHSPTDLTASLISEAAGIQAELSLNTYPVVINVPRPQRKRKDLLS